MPGVCKRPATQLGGMHRQPELYIDSRPPRRETLRVERQHANDPTPRAVVLEPHSAADLGEERVVFA